MGLRPPDQVAGRRALTALLALLTLAFPATAAAATGPELVGYVNALRAAHGIPAGIVENPFWSAGCSLHNHYGAVNGVLTHAELDAAPAFTGPGATAGATSVLYRGALWTAAANPFEHAPIHLHQLLAPRLDAMGAWESEGYGCATTLASRDRPAPPRPVVYTYPADGTRGWRTGEVADELPFTPGELLGIAPDTPTGPYLYVLFDGPDMAPTATAEVTSASLTGPAGPVALLVADNTTPGLEGYLPPGAELIPRARLEPGTSYSASVQARVGDARFNHRWSFTTTGAPLAGSSRAAPTATAARSPEIGGRGNVRALRRGGTLQVRLRCPRACLVRGIGQLAAGGGATRRLPYARAGRLTEGPIRLRFNLSPGARGWLATHRSVRLRLSVSGLFVAPLRARLPYARTSGSSSAYLPLASSDPASG